MQDMLVRLYDLPTTEALEQKMNASKILPNLEPIIVTESDVNIKQADISAFLIILFIIPTFCCRVYLILV